MRKEIHGLIDLDDTCFGWVEWMIETVGEEPDPAGLFSGSILEMWPDKDPDYLLDLVQDVRGYLRARPVPEAAGTLTWLALNFPFVKLSYVSAAPTHAIHERLEAMRQANFPLPVSNPSVLRVTHVGGHGEKVRWMRESFRKFDFMIDDSLKYMVAGEELGIPFRYLISKPWNWESNDHIRILSWGHFRQSILRDLRKMTQPVMA